MRIARMAMIKGKNGNANCHNGNEHGQTGNENCNKNLPEWQ